MSPKWTKTRIVIEITLLLQPFSCLPPLEVGYGSRMEWTWRTATESNMPNSPKSTNSVQEVFHEVSQPNPMGNAVMSEETHGNALQLLQSLSLLLTLCP